MKKSLIKIGVVLFISAFLCFFQIGFIQDRVEDLILLNAINICILLGSPVLLISGIVFIVYGLIRRKKDKKNIASELTFEDKNEENKENKDLIFYLNGWGDRGEHGSERISLKKEDNLCKFMYVSTHFNDYSSVYDKSIKRNEAYIEWDIFKEWNFEEITEFINKEFRLNIKTSECTGAEVYELWMEKVLHT